MSDYDKLPETDQQRQQILKGETVQVIWEHDFNKVVQSVYGKPYVFQQQGDMLLGQNGYYPFTVHSAEKYQQWDATEIDAELTRWLSAEPPQNARAFTIQLWWERENYPDIDVILYDLAYRRGLMASGRYALHVWW